MANMWLYINDGSSDTLELDEKSNEVVLGGNKRAFKIEEFAASNGGYLRGIGNYSAKEISITRREKAENGDTTAWNSRRHDFEKFFTLPPYKDLYFYMLDGEGTTTVRTKIVPIKLPEDKYKNYRISDDRDYKCKSITGIWESINSSSGTVAITGSAEQNTSVTNDGIVEAKTIFYFTPTAGETSWEVKLNEEYGFLISGVFNAGEQIEFNMNTGILKINNAITEATSYLTKSPFLIPPGTSTLYVTCSGAGTFGYQIYERWV